jgi:peptidoglycan-associated lipoprotein
MKAIVKNTILSVCAAGLLAGCGSKNVEYPDTKPKKQTKKAVVVDNKMDKVAGVQESAISDNANNIVTNDNATQQADQLTQITDESVNSVTSDINGQVVVLESVHFAFDKYTLTDKMREIATTNYTKIDKASQNYPNLKVKLEGNCDEWGTDEYNYALGLKRAKTAKDALVEDGIDPKDIIMVSFGESNPVCTQKTEACWKMNRRVDYRLLP